MKRRNKWLIGLGSLLVLVMLIVGGASFYLYHFAFQPTPKVLSHASAKSERVLATNQKWLRQTDKQTWRMESATDHLRLVADYLPASHKTTKTIIVAHGYMNKKEDMANYIRMYHRLGYNVLAPDDRGAGQSQGKYIGFGWPDRLDYVKWIHKVIQTNGTNSQIGLFGVSMGGATVMMTSGEKLPKQVKAIVEDCGYQSVESELSYELKNLYNLPKFPLIYTTNVITQARAHYNFLTASSTKQLAKNHLPVFFIHGSDDTFVPTKDVYANYAATKGYKQLWVVKGATHAASYVEHPAEYQTKVQAFFGRFM